MRLDGDESVGTRGDGADRPLSALTREELSALVGALEGRIRAGTASLEDFGVLARSRRELAGRVDEGGAPAGPASRV